MASDEGSQIVTIRFHRPVDSDVVNKRFQDIRMLGIHKGGYLTITAAPQVSLSPLVCEISDGTHQVRVETTVAVTKTLTVGNPYLILSWDYSGVEDTDFMVITTSGLPDEDDIIVGKGIFTEGVLTSIDYSNRTSPDTHHLFLRVEEMETPSTYVKVRAGVGHAASAHSSIVDRNVLISGYSGGDEVYVYVNDAGGIAHSKTAANYVGKALLAKIVYPADGIIENSDIEDTRSFITPPAIPDESSITRNSTGKLQVKTSFLTNKGQSAQAVGTSNISTGSSSYTDMANMSITMTTTGGNVLIMFGATMRTGEDWGGMHRLLVDGNQKVAVAWENGNNAGVQTAPIHWLEVALPAGSHTCKIQWKKQGITIYQDGATYRRVLTAIELPS